MLRIVLCFHYSIFVIENHSYNMIHWLLSKDMLTQYCISKHLYFVDQIKNEIQENWHLVCQTILLTSTKNCRNINSPAVKEFSFWPIVRCRFLTWWYIMLFIWKNNTKHNTSLSLSLSTTATRMLRNITFKSPKSEPLLFFV